MARAVFIAVLVVRLWYTHALLGTPLASWHLWMETDEHAFVEWSAHLAAGNWVDVPAYRAYFNWQQDFGPPEEWEHWYQKNAYYAGPLYPYGLAALRVLFGSPFLPARLLQLLLACVASAALALAVRRISEDFLGREREQATPFGGDVTGRGGDRVVFWCAFLAGVLYGTYGPLVFHDSFLYRDGPVAHVSTLLLALPLVARRSREEEEKKNSLKGEEGRTISRGGWFALLLGLLGGFAMLLKQTTAPLALASLWAFSFSSLSPSSPSRKSLGGAKRRSFFLMALGLLGLGFPLSVLAVRNISAGVPPLTFDTRQAIGLAWGNAFGADATTNPPPGMEEILDEAAGSTTKTARLVLESYRGAAWALPKLLLKKFTTFWNAFEVPDNASFYFFRDRIRILRSLPVFPCLLGVGIIGLCAALARGVLRREEGLLAAIAILTPLAACLLVQTTSRYRAAVAGPLALGAGLFLFSLFTFKEKQRDRVRSASLFVLTAGALSLVPLLPSVIPAGRHRFSDTMVYATLLEGAGKPEEAAREVQRYLDEGGDDTQRNAGIVSLRHWYETGDRSGTLVAPEGIAPPERRFRKKD